MRDIARSHAVLEAAILSLEWLAERLATRAAPGPEERRAAAAVLECFDRTAPEHHRDEERRLFPDLRASAASAGRPELAATLYELEMEHERMERFFRESIRPALQAIAAGERFPLGREDVAHLAWVYRRHTSMEAQVLEPLGGRP